MTKENQAKVASDLMTYTTINDNDIEGLLNAFRPGLDFFFASDLAKLQELFESQPRSLLSHVWIGFVENCSSSNFYG